MIALEDESGLVEATLDDLVDARRQKDSAPSA
jgi:hypothetical protein